MCAGHAKNIDNFTHHFSYLQMDKEGEPVKKQPMVYICGGEKSF